MMWFRRGSREDPVILDKRLTAIERQLSISRIVAGGTGTGLIVPGGGLSTLYVPFSQHGGLVVDSSGWYRVPFSCTLSNIWVKLGTASSSGSVTVRVTDGTTNWDNTLTSSDDFETSAPAASLDQGDFLKAQVTAAGTGAEDLVVVVALDPT